MRTLNLLVPVLVLVCTAGLFGVGCKSAGGSAASSGESSSRSSKFVMGEPPPAGHVFAKLTRGMGTGEVHDLVGEPTDRGGNITGKNFNPFYYGTDTHRETWYYKGQGRLTFNSRGRLIEVRYIADERGYR